ncbi:MAG: hypothetical protein KatS3mg070_0124 [Meiothermus sp.]|uniref:tetratricopeptide repeat protein n=1 Tax=Meiothermus sp. TaxID=1955249 RepID=UPI0021DD53B0|nr:tetratricopeptide repeat protein [Meiothermus sp.]GIW26761.1 MAG: hypothetical protein KatS3mg070_0124 [Meiothermus sp.]
MKLASFGKVGLEGVAFSRPKPLLLLAYVTLEGPQERRKLAELFWQEGGSKALGNLSVVLAQFKKEGAAEVFPDKPGVNPLPSQVGCDALEFLEALEVRDLERAIGLYGGPFLHDLGKPVEALEVSDELLDWVLEKREFFAQKAQEAMLERAEELVGQQPKQARALAERAYSLIEAPELEPALLTRFQQLLAQTGSDLSRRVGSAAKASLDDLPETARRVFLALALQEQPNLTIVRSALETPLGELSQAHETLILSGLIDANNRVLAGGSAQGWLEAHPSERLSLLLALARHTPPEAAYALYRQILEHTQGFGGVGDLLRARTAYTTRAKTLMVGLKFAEAAALLEQIRAVERVLETDPDSESRFLEAYALERLGRFKEALELLQALPEKLRNPNITALESVLLWRRGMPQEAQQAARSVLESGVNWLWAKATANNTLGYLAGSRGDFLEAASYFKKAAALFQTAGARDRWVGSLNNYAIELDKIAREAEKKGVDATALESARAEAEQAYRQALEALDQAGKNPLLRARILLNLGILWERRKDWARAEAQYLEAVPFAEAAGALEIIARLHLNLGYTYSAQRNFAEARSRFSNALHFASKAGELLTQGVAMAHLADLDDDPDVLEVALSLMEQSGHLDEVGDFLVNYEGVLKRLIGKAHTLEHHEKVRRLEGRLVALYQQYRKDDGSMDSHVLPPPPRQN